MRTNSEADDHLNVHIIAHTHDDVGWLKTVDQYYYGANTSIQDAGVQYILDTTVQALLDNPDRKFIYVEIAFFARWWNEQSEYKKTVVRDLVRTGRLEFINGGWCMNDEANTEYEAIIEQMSLGHMWLFREFGVRPRIGWHIDPFGHANTQASLFAQMGFDAFFFGRIDYQDHSIRNANKELEFVWRGSDSLGKQSDIFTHVLYTDYCFLHGFGFEDGADPIQDDPRLFDPNVKERCDLFAEKIRTRSQSFKTNHVMIPFGCDFKFQNAHLEFKNMDKIIKYINEHYDDYHMTLKYSTPSIYIDEINKIDVSWSLNIYDFMPYADRDHAYWSGYFTSRPTLKGYVRDMTSLLESTDKMLTSVLGTSGANKIDVNSQLDKISKMEDAHGIAQHHDAVAGTEKQHVAYDYAKRLSIGQENCFSSISDILGQLITIYGTGSPPSFSFCPLMNETICPSTNVLKNSQNVPLVIYNPIGWKRSYYARIPVPISNVRVIDETGSVVLSQVIPSFEVTGMFVLTWEAVLPPMGYSTYVIERTSSEFTSIHQSPTADVVLENAFLRITVSASNGGISSIYNKQLGKNVQITQDYLWYNSSIGNNDLSTQPSGAYIFRPNRTEPFSVAQGNPTYTFVTGKVVQEVYQVWSNWVSQVIRLYTTADFIEFESTVGEIPIEDGLGKEVITRFQTNMNTAKLWWTDSEGQEMQKRELNKRPTWNYQMDEPVASNYYPMNTAAYIRDSSSNLQLTMITDRSRGMSSLGVGQFETMIHRRLLHDDYRGVGEPLNETTVVRTSQLMGIQSVDQALKNQRRLAILHNHKPVIAFTSTSQPAVNWLKLYNTNYTALSYPLPANVHLLTFKTLDDGRVLLRLNHIFAVGEDSVYSQPATVDIGTLFDQYQIIQLTEMTLSANRPLSELNRLKWKIKGETENAQSTITTKLTDFKITLNPMQIRTFLARLQPRP